jgi:pimeloyl-ACP methyl ester carboxylesterase
VRYPQVERYLKDWNITDRLPEIRVPTLVTGGRYDEITPKCAETIHNGIPDPKKYLQTVREFILS